MPSASFALSFMCRTKHFYGVCLEVLAKFSTPPDRAFPHPFYVRNSFLIAIHRGEIDRYGRGEKKVKSLQRAETYGDLLHVLYDICLGNGQSSQSFNPVFLM